jgi:hypothetical protein
MKERLAVKSESTCKNICLSTNSATTYHPLAAYPIYITASTGSLSKGHNTDNTHTHTLWYTTSPPVPCRKA